MSRCTRLLLLHVKKSTWSWASARFHTESNYYIFQLTEKNLIFYFIYEYGADNDIVWFTVAACLDFCGF